MMNLYFPHYLSFTKHFKLIQERKLFFFLFLLLPHRLLQAHSPRTHYSVITSAIIQYYLILCLSLTLSWTHSHIRSFTHIQTNTHSHPFIHIQIHTDTRCYTHTLANTLTHSVTSIDTSIHPSIHLYIYLPPPYEDELRDVRAHEAEDGSGRAHTHRRRIRDGGEELRGEPREDIHPPVR